MKTALISWDRAIRAVFLLGVTDMESRKYVVGIEMTAEAEAYINVAVEASSRSGALEKVNRLLRDGNVDVYRLLHDLLKSQGFTKQRTIAVGVIDDLFDDEGIDLDLSAKEQQSQG